MILSQDEKVLLYRMQDGKIKSCEVARLDVKRGLIEKGYMKIIFSTTEGFLGYRISPLGLNVIKE